MNEVVKRARKETAAGPGTPGEGVECNLPTVPVPPAPAKRRLPAKAYVPDDEDDEDEKPSKQRTTPSIGSNEDADCMDEGDRDEVEPEKDLTDEAARVLVAEGEGLSGDALKDFLKRNFTDFVNDKMLDFADIADIDDM